MAITQQLLTQHPLPGNKGTLSIRVISDSIVAPNSTLTSTTSQSAGSALLMPVADGSQFLVNEYVNITGGFVGGGDLFNIITLLSGNNISVNGVPYVAALSIGTVVQQLYRVDIDELAQNIEIIDVTNNIRYWWNRSMGFGITMKQTSAGVISKLGRTGSANSTKGIYVYPNYMIVDPSIFVPSSEFSIRVEY